MPPVHRLGDIGTGHGCWPPRPNAEASPDVKVNGIFVHRKSDGWQSHCLIGSTKIPLLDGSKTKIKDLVNNTEKKFVYSCTENGSIIPGKIAKAWITSYTNEIYKIYLDNKEINKCSSDHLFMLRNGEYKKAKDLKKNQSLMPLYRKHNELGYEEIFDNNKDKFIKTHKISALTQGKSLKNAKKRIGIDGNKFVVVYHRNFDKKNNNPLNLKWMGNLDHWYYHSELGYNIWANLTPIEYRKRCKFVGRQQKEMIKNGEHNFINDHPMNYNKNRKAVIKSNRRRLKNGNHPFIEDNPMKKDEIRNQVSNSLKHRWEHIPEGERERHSIKISNGYQSKPEKEKEEFKKKVKKDVRKRARNGSHHFVNNNPMKDNSKKISMCHSKIINVYKKIKSSGKGFNSKNYEKFKFPSAPGWNKVKHYFNSLKELEQCSYNNHKVVKVEKVKLKKKIPLYDIKVENRENTHNFAVESGVFIHNC